MKNPTIHPRTTHWEHWDPTDIKFRAEGEDLPDGVIGRLSGIGVRYGVWDSYGTRFKAGCLERTKSEKIPARKVKLFVHGGTPGMHEYGVKNHAGTVFKSETVGNAEVITADIFDTQGGRDLKEYLTAVLSSKSETGLSIGFRVREYETVDMEDGDYDRGTEFTEVELIEFTVTPSNAVPGADMLAVRTEDKKQMVKTAMRVAALSLTRAEAIAIVDEIHPPQDSDSPDARSGSPADGSDDANQGKQDRPATMEERVAAVRQSYGKVGVPDENQAAEQES